MVIDQEYKPELNVKWNGRKKIHIFINYSLKNVNKNLQRGKKQFRLI